MANRSGWAYGFQKRDGEWLTIVGSAYQAPRLLPSRDDAEAALGQTKLDTWNLSEGLQLVTAHVTGTWHASLTGLRRPYAYRITAGTAQPTKAAPSDCACGHPANAHDVGVGICDAFRLPAKTP
jgi:hypothetical protein